MLWMVDGVWDLEDSRSQRRDLPTAYFLPGGRGRPPCWKEATYSLFLASKFCCTGVAMSDASP